jgi:hypothetical protein
MGSDPLASPFDRDGEFDRRDQNYAEVARRVGEEIAKKSG